MNKLDLLQVSGNQIIDSNGNAIFLRGVCVGGWMNMEEFINGNPGSEHGIRQAVSEVLNTELSSFFFDQMLDNFFGEDDVAFIKSLGATVIRLPINYRHFESDDQPFSYTEAGFERLDQALSWCEKYNLYAIIDLHAVQGWQNTDWHSDNSTRHSLFWTHKHFQDRFVSLWEALARRYRGKTVVAGYNVMNEPVTNTPFGRFPYGYQPNWSIINHVYRRVVEAIRVIDPEHIIFLEGDYYSSQFDGFDPPFAPNLVYSSHNYNSAGFGPGAYPGIIKGEKWDIDQQRKVFFEHSGTRYCMKHNVPLWVGEFGAAYNGPKEEIADRLRALDDQLSVYAETNTHWTMWTYKDIDVMGWVQLDPKSSYIQTISETLQAKKKLATDFWMRWLAPTAAQNKLNELATLVESVLEDEKINPTANRTYLAQSTLSGYVAGLMQSGYTRHFEGKTYQEIEQIMQSFRFQNSIPHQALIDIVKRQLRTEE
jgi:endoglucanase